MQWLWLKVRTSVRLGWQDTFQVQRPRVTTGLLVNTIAFALTWVGTHRPGALWTLAAYPAYVIGTFGVYVTRRLSGWNRLWQRESRIAHPPDGPSQLNLSIMTTGPVALLLNVPLEITCCVRDPAGNEFEANDVRGFRGQIYCTYPAQFSRAPALTPGIYTVTWRERKPPESGKWRVVDVSRVEVPAEAPASTAPPTPNSAAITEQTRKSALPAEVIRQLFPGTATYNWVADPIPAERRGCQIRCPNNSLLDATYRSV